MISGLLPASLISQNAPVSTIAAMVTTGSADTVSITASDFTDIRSCNLKMIYDPAVLFIDTVVTGPLLGGVLSIDLTTPGIITLGWFTYPVLTLADNSVIFNIAFTRVGGCTSAISWSDNGISCVWYDVNYTLLNDIPPSMYYINGAVTFAFPLAADFMAGNTTPPKNTTVQLTDLSTGCPGSWNWSFDRSSVVYVNNTDTHSRNPQVQFTDGGLYTVTLFVQNGYYSDTKVKTGYVRAGISGLWSGTISSDWMAPMNWDNWLVPGSSTDVVVAGTASDWPQFTGNCTLGTDCKSVTLNGASQATITGNFTINAGSSLNFTNNGILKVGGNWVNNGSFNSGNGTVDFTGAGQASILGGTPPTLVNTFYNLKLSKTSGTLNIIPNITVNGNLLINP
jgi:PKD repeat protein